MLLALLRLVGGLVGGALGGLPAPAGSLTPLWFDAERAIMGGTARLSEDAGLFSPAPGGGAVDGGLDRFGGGADADADVEAGGGGVEVGPARGGGGVAVLAGVFSAPGFLLIHRLRSGSYTKLLCSPSLALIGLLPLPRFSSFFAPPPPNHPPKPQPFLAGFSASAARFAGECKSASCSCGAKP